MSDIEEPGIISALPRRERERHVNGVIPYTPISYDKIIAYLILQKIVGGTER
jgi:hypothetical protein